MQTKNQSILCRIRLVDLWRNEHFNSINFTLLAWKKVWPPSSTFLPVASDIGTFLFLLSISSSTSIMSIRQQVYQCSNFYVIFLYIFNKLQGSHVSKQTWFNFSKKTDLLQTQRHMKYRPFWYYSSFRLSGLHIWGQLLLNCCFDSQGCRI